MIYQSEPPKKTKNYMGGATAMQNLTLGDDASWWPTYYYHINLEPKWLEVGMWVCEGDYNKPP